MSWVDIKSSMTKSPLFCLQDLDSDFPTASALEDSNALALAIIPEGKSFLNEEKCLLWLDCSTVSIVLSPLCGTLTIPSKLL